MRRCTIRRIARRRVKMRCRRQSWKGTMSRPPQCPITTPKRSSHPRTTTDAKGVVVVVPDRPSKRLVGQQSKIRGTNCTTASPPFDTYTVIASSPANTKPTHAWRGGWKSSGPCGIATTTITSATAAAVVVATKGLVLERSTEQRRRDSPPLPDRHR